MRVSVAGCSPRVLFASSAESRARNTAAPTEPQMVGVAPALVPAVAVLRQSRVFEYRQA